MSKLPSPTSTSETPIQAWADAVEARLRQPFDQLQAELIAMRTVVESIRAEDVARAERRSLLFCLWLIWLGLLYGLVVQPLLKAGIQTTRTVVTGTLDAIAPDFKAIPQKGEVIAGYRITSGYGPRLRPCVGCSQFHAGVDAGTPIGTTVYAVGHKGETVQVTCFWDTGGGGLVANVTTPRFPNLTLQYLHLSRCSQGQQPAGSVIARTGQSGLGTGPHLDFRLKQSGQRIPPWRGLLWWSLTGQPPKPLASRNSPP